MKPEPVLDRQALERLPRQQLGRPSALKPAVWRVAAPGGTLIVKDVLHSPPWTRWIARAMLRREREILRRLSAVDGVPHLAGRIDRNAIALTWVPGRQLDKRIFRARPRELMRQMGELTERLHAAGVFHLDLHQRNNFLVDERGRLSIVDFGSAVAPNRLTRALFGRFLRRSDEHAGYKFLARFAPEELTDDEARTILEQRALRRLWFFTPSSSREIKAARKRLS
jgi:serine/threonine protein kinase